MPFTDTARELAQTKDYVTMQVECDGVRSHTWWRKLVERGPWGEDDRVSPPGPETWAGFARLFGTTADQVRTMIAADWYGVGGDAEISARTLRLGPILDSLKKDDADLVETLARRLT